MAGTIFGLGLSQQFDANGEPLSGCLLYIYAAGTSTPSTAYEDFGLTTGLELPFPIVADSAGRIPAFWLADGSYRVRLTTSTGVEVFDETSITAIGASSGTSSGSGVSATAIFDTGDTIWIPRSGTRSGWVRMNGRTIGSSSSGATERASSDTEDLFLHLWTNYSDTYAPVTGGRGASAAEDWAANKVIGVPDMRGRLPLGLDDMGNTAASVVSAATTAAAPGGASTKTIAKANIPVYNLSHTLSLPNHTHDSGSLVLNSATITNGTQQLRNTSTTSITEGTGSTVTSVRRLGEEATVSVNDRSCSGNTGNPNSLPSINGSIASDGSGTAMDVMNPYRAGSWYMKL